VKKLRAFIELTRIEHGVVVGLVPVATYLLTSNTVNYITIIILYLTSLLAEIYLFTLNDICNIPEDRINRPNAPLIRGDFSIKSAYIVAIISLISGLTISIISTIEGLLNLTSLTVYIIALALGTAYNIKLKRVCLVGNFITSLTTSLSFIYGMYRISIIPISLFIISLIACIGREVAKSIIDIEGDRVAGLNTLPIKYGIEISRKVVKSTEMAASIMLLVLTTMLIFYYMSKILTYIPLIFACIVVSLLTIYTTSKYDDFRKIRKLLLLYMSMLIIAYFLTGILNYLSWIY